MDIKIKLLNEAAKIPTQSPGNAGCDLYASEDVVIPPLERRLVKTGISLEIPAGYYGHIADRSGMAYKNGGTCLAGVIDEGYRGEVGIVLFNSDKEIPINIKAGDRPAQIIFKKYADVNFLRRDELSESNRGEKGYGSSGQ